VLHLESDLAEHLDRQTKSFDGLESAVQLLRIESATELTGSAAVVAQIEHWAPQLAKAPGMEVTQIREQLERTVTAAGELGPESFDEFETAIDTTENAACRHWLMQCLSHTDPRRAEATLAEMVRGLKHSPDSQTRLRAARILTDLDRVAAGEALRDVLLRESERGFRDLPPQVAKRYEEFVQKESFPMFFHFIGAFVETGVDSVEPTLLQILLNDTHGRMTYQECVKHLGELRSKPALERIKSLFYTPPFGFPEPIFKNTCLDAIAKIEGEDACEFFETALLEQQQPTVRSKLQDLIKRLRSGD
ncbi:MAG: hypothetical protein KDB80_01815, partial [Planctomycetes bacterium]|nr:hypothetical protein [Planctomycetota bacterium]